MLLFRYNNDNFDEWDEFCKNTIQGTFLHTRKFLSYHKDKFLDHSLILRSDDKIIGLFAAAEHPTDKKTIVSHPGITYGGVLHAGDLYGEHMLEGIKLLAQHYKNSGYTKLVYKTIPFIYHKAPSQDDLYAMFRIGATRFRTDLSCAIDLTHRLHPSSRRIRSLKKAIKSGIKVVSNSSLVGQLWAVLSENLELKHGAKPVHSTADIMYLMEVFPDAINCICAVYDNQVIAGVVTFETEDCTHAQYIASNKKGNELSALDAVFNYLIEFAQSQNKRWFDFGISNENNGQILNSGLFNFKCEFGGGGITHDFYEVDLVA
jgi:hypothetical protein